ncbi:glycosyltransferase family 4 protein [Mucilaginibacter sp. UYCu711]|uniref:glycosyltransferase family 4 protein n=1 Tax=Mucilaginibacter sp. UYCu711 TaxID=3156339 RepID=UPI003D1B9D34
MEYRIAIVTTCSEDWGGSEELWAKTIPYLQSYGYTITVYKKNLNLNHQEFIKLARSGVELQELNITKSPFHRHIAKRIFNKICGKETPYNTESQLKMLLILKKPVLCIISQGINFDGTGLGYICLENKIPYVLIAQKAVDFYWPPNADRAAMRKVYINAMKCYFVAHHNKLLTEEQFGVRLVNTEIVSNPIKIKREILPMPTIDDGYRLACIGRYFLLDKGQDILIRIMAAEKWKNRPVRLSFFGTGDDKTGLVEMAKLLKATNVEFLDYYDDMEQLWLDHHALVLAARSEGTPLVLLEAMACGRTSIVSYAGGNSELITDGESGFLGQANERDFDDALERAWQQRNDWEIIGQRAHAHIVSVVPQLPQEELAKSLMSLLNE